MTSHRRFRFPVIVTLLAIGLCGCEKGEAVPDVQVPYGPITPAAVTRAKGTLTPLIPGTTLTMGEIGTKEVGGRTYSRYGMAYDVPEATGLTAATSKMEVWLDGLGTDSVTIAGFHSIETLGGMLTGPVTATLTEPVTVDLHPPVGAPQTRTVSATTALGGAATLVANYQLAEEDVAVDTAMGTVTGCRHFTGSASINDGTGIPASFQGFSASGDVWWHPSFGVVAAKIPGVGVDTDLLDQTEWSAPKDGVVIGRKAFVLDSAHTSATFSTYDRAGELDADMCVHTKMLAEVRWANDADAKTRGAPDPLLFGVRALGGMGQFCWGACPLVESPVSIFHPEDNGKGYKFWYTYTDQALKNEYNPKYGNGSSYSLEARTDPMLPPIRVTMRIGYSIANPASDCSM